MFFVQKIKKTSRAPIIGLHFYTSITIFCALALLTMVGWRVSRTSLLAEHQKLTDQQVSRVKGTISQRLSIYEEVLRGGVALFNSSNNVSRAEWEAYVNTFSISQRFPGIGGLGFSIVVPADQLAEHEASMQADGLLNYHIYPELTRNDYTAIIYLEPHAQSTNIFGYDMFSEPARHAAMSLARDTNNAQTTSLVTLLPDQVNQTDNSGFLMYLPVYQHGMPHDSVVERRAAIYGYVFALFRSYTLFPAIIKDDLSDNNFGFRLYMGDHIDDKSLMYESPAYKNLLKQHAVITRRTTFVIDGSTWFLEMKASDKIVSLALRRRPPNILVVGLLVSAMIAFFVFVLLNGRARSLYYQEQQEVQKAKDELLALASHQLRTPATGVKQYVGMLLDGYGGKLKPQVQTMLQRAYDSNERQLQIISEILHVARADTGRIELTKAELDVSVLLRDIINEQRATFEGRSQTLTELIPKKKLLILADAKYLRMALENILDNASKYTPDGGRISVHLGGLKGKISIQIKDSGVGISKDEMPQLFRKFSRIYNHLSAKVGGSGIGLYLAEHIVLLHGGEIQVDSAPGKGSNFTVILPRH